MNFKESENVELKEIYVDDIKKEIIAFANTHDGLIYVGVSDDGKVVGLENPDEISLKISNSVRDTIRPDVSMFVSYKILEVENKNILKIQVSRGTARPYYLESKGLKPVGVYVRQGNSSAPASDFAIRKMIKETDGDEFELMRSLNQELTFTEAKKEFKMRGIELKTSQMKSLGLINSDDIYTNLALLLSDQCPHIIKVAAFNGIDQQHFQNREEYDGSILKQLNDCYRYLIMSNQLRATFKGLYRIDSRDYPEEALREALLNAIVHRDYSNLANTFINIYSNRIEFISYGGIAGDATLDDVLNGISICRNRKLADIFYRLNLIEAFGTGLAKMNRAYKEHGLRPDFSVTSNSFKTILPNVNESKTSDSKNPLENYMSEIAKFIEENGEVTRKEIESSLGVSSATAVRILKKLKDEGFLYSIGNGKNTKYIIKY